MPSSPQTLRLAEVLGALSLATDLANGNPLETALRTFLLAVELARETGASEQEIADAYDAAMLRYLGCTAYAPEEAAALGDDIAAKQLYAPVDFGRWECWRALTTSGWMARATTATRRPRC